MWYYKQGSLYEKVWILILQDERSEVEARI
jgi:hypothetical protein